jgi:hypothetical protein
VQKKFIACGDIGFAAPDAQNFYTGMVLLPALYTFAISITTSPDGAPRRAATKIRNDMRIAP